MPRPNRSRIGAAGERAARQAGVLGRRAGEAPGPAADHDAMSCRSGGAGAGRASPSIVADGDADPRSRRRAPAQVARGPAGLRERAVRRRPGAHLQAIGRDAAGRLQYRYHPEWEKVREARKAQRLTRLVEALPRIRRSIAQHLAAPAADPRAGARRGDRAGRAQRHPARQRELRPHARDARRCHLAEVEHHACPATPSRSTFRSKGGQEVDKEFAAPACVR